MSKIGESPVSIRNYWLEKYIEDENATYEDGTERVWKYDCRVTIVEPLIRDTAHFAMDVEKRSEAPSMFDEGDAVLKCIEGDYDIATAKSWLFSYFYQHAIHQANAIYALFLTSHISQGFQLWRSLFEAHIICEFLNKHLLNSALIRDYISHTMLRSWIRTMQDVNALCARDNVESKYDESQIARCKELYASKSWKLSEDYGWAKLVLEGNRCNFRHILEQVDSDMTIFYRISSMEIHPTVGQRFALFDLGCLPLPTVPASVFGVIDRDELQLDFLTAKVLHRITCRTDAFVSLDRGLQKRFKSLKSKGMEVLEERKRETSPIMPDGRPVVVHRGG